MEIDRRTLVIDDTFKPIKIIDWKRAICYLISKRGYPIDEYEDFLIRSVTLSIKVPKILQIKGKSPVSFKDREVSLTNNNIYLRDNHTCAYCLKNFKQSELSIDHIIPKCQGGLNTWENLITSCNKCNNKKGGRTPEQANMKLNFFPKKMYWSPKKHLGIRRKEFEEFSSWIF